MKWDFQAGDGVWYLDRKAKVIQVDKDKCLIEFEDNGFRVWVSGDRLQHIKEV